MRNLKSLKTLALIAAIGAALVPVTAQAFDASQFIFDPVPTRNYHLPPVGTAIGSIMQTKHDVPVCQNLDENAIKFRDAWEQFMHRLRPYISKDELSRRRPNGCGYISAGQWTVVRDEHLRQGTPQWACQSIYDDLESAKDGSRSDTCYWAALTEGDWLEIKLGRIRLGLDPQTGREIDQ